MGIFQPLRVSTVRSITIFFPMQSSQNCKLMNSTKQQPCYRATGRCGQIFSFLRCWFYLSIMIEGKGMNLDSISFGRGAVDIDYKEGWDLVCQTPFCRLFFFSCNSSFDVDVYAHFGWPATHLWNCNRCVEQIDFLERFVFFSPFAAGCQSKGFILEML